MHEMAVNKMAVHEIEVQHQRRSVVVATVECGGRERERERERQRRKLRCSTTGGDVVTVAGGCDGSGGSEER
ncbi:hypothetical protein DEO72_LG8g1895 [Vigna unguiculata]|uniref:Uncharacterized protein n=1 Tax=Vigna unguiculata TaxID=3917 RepID=A0A4D6MQU7_VIGUN|nr:hypothetical protein DEO72_LG8g1894 [Vigna unguiculata]QCE03866.1 hypothetical protein DEO72_LG8g1895 [Vigna unguiculata]